MMRSKARSNGKFKAKNRSIARMTHMIMAPYWRQCRRAYETPVILYEASGFR